MTRDTASHVTPRSELRTIGRNLSDLEPRHGGRTAWAPAAWSALGMLLVGGFIIWLMLGPPPASLNTPRQSAVFSTPRLARAQ